MVLWVLWLEVVVDFRGSISDCGGGGGWLK